MGGRHRGTGLRRTLGAAFAGSLALGTLGAALLSASSPAGAATKPRTTTSPVPGSAPTAKPHRVIRHTPAAPAGHQAAPVPARPAAPAVPAAPVPPGTSSLFVANYGANSITAYPASDTGNVRPWSEVTTGLQGPSGAAFDSHGNLWVANYTADTLAEFGPSQLAAGGSMTPEATLWSTALDWPTGIAVDRTGNLWVANYGNSTVVEFTASELMAGGRQNPAITITQHSTSLDGPAGLAFDASGNLWVGNYKNSTVVEFTSAQLAAGGRLAPTLILSSTATSLYEPYLMTFDPAGNLWVPNDASSTVVEIAKATLADTGTEKAVPAATLSSPALTAPSDLAFDNSDDLWVDNFTGTTVVEFTPAALSTGGSVVPKVTLSSDGTNSLDGPFGLTFDSAGDLWATNYTGNSVVELTATALATTGAPNPKVTVSTFGSPPNGPSGVVFDKAGDLWVANFTNDSVVEYTASSLARGAPAPKVALTPTGLDGPTGLAFDSTGNLWVTNASGDSVVEYTRAALGASGSPTPKLKLKTSSTSLHGPEGLTFDAAGNLWVTNFTVDSVVEIAKPTLMATGAVNATPAVTVTSSSFNEPTGLTFDAAGDLWVTNYTGTSVVELTQTALSTGGTQSPKVSLTTDSTTSLDGPAGLAFDAAGNLWVASYTGNSVVEYTPSELTAGGPQAPASVISGAATGLFEPRGIAIFAPAPSTTTVQVTPTSVSEGTTVTYSASVASTVNGTPTGAVAFSVGGTSLCTATLSTGSGSCTAANAPVGTDTVTGAYSGDDSHKPSQGTATLTVTAKRVTTPVTKATSSGNKGYWEVASDGGIFAFGTAPFYGSMGGKLLNAPIVGMAATPTGKGYWEVAADGGIFAFGTAPFYGSMGGKPLNSPIVGMAATPTGKGYWEVAADGGIFAFGTAPFYGSMGGKPLNQPVVGVASTSTGKGYYEVAADGGIFAFGTAPFYGSMAGKPLNQPVVGVASTSGGNGYYEVAADGGIFAFGTAPFYGSMGGKPLDRPVVGVASTSGGKGYWEIASDGGVFAFGDAPFLGSEGGKPLNAPVAGMAAGAA